MKIYCLVYIDTKFINVKGEGTCDVNSSCHSYFFYVKDMWKHSDINPPTVVTFCMQSTPTVYIVLACMVIQFFIYFIECVHLIHLSTAEYMEEGRLWWALSESWNFYLTHQLNRTYVDTLGGRLDGVPSYPVIQRNTIEQQAGKRKPYSPILIFPSQVRN